MLLWMMGVALLSVFSIMLVHHLIVFLKNMLTVPKIKDLVHMSQDKYDDIHFLLKNKQTTKTNATPIDALPSGSGSTEYGSAAVENDMKNELKLFLKKQLQQTI